jgi:two-component system NtrC family sensor kinase
LYVPLTLHGHVFGVLGVDNRHQPLPLTQHHVGLLQALSGYAAIALENARLYEAAAAERGRLEALLAGVHDGVIVIDSDGRLLMVNPAARDAFGIPPAQALAGVPFGDAFPQAEMAALLHAAGEGVSNPTEISPDEKRIFAAQALRIEGVGLVLTLHDITYLKRLDRIKSDFVQTVSHDLRSPLTAILGYVELIERAGAVTDLQREFIRRIQGSVANITCLVDDLLDLGRIESGFDLRRENVRLDQVVRYAAEGMKKAIAEKGLRLAVHFSQDFPAFAANPVQMRQMIDNLFGNAIKYSNPGGAIGVSGRIEQKQIILQFTDTGIGIPTMDLPYIFDKFYRAGNVSPELTGTGLGLAIVRSVVENHGGRIWVESTVGQGTTFTVVLPHLEE